MSGSPKNLYEKSLEFGKDKKNLGFDYHQEDVILKKTMMPRMFLNENVKGFLSYVNNIIVNNIDSVKIVRNFFNYTVKKTDTDVN